VDALAREKNVPKETVFGALESALASAYQAFVRRRGRRREGVGGPREPASTTRTGAGWWCRTRRGFRRPGHQIILSDARDQIPDIELEEFIEEQLPRQDLGRRFAQDTKQVILQKIRDAEREQLLSEFLARNDAIVNGTVKRMDKGDAIIEIGKVEARLPRSEMIPKENLRVGDRVRALVAKVDRQLRGPQIILSRTSPEFLMKLFELEGSGDRAGAASDQVRPRVTRGFAPRSPCGRMTDGSTLSEHASECAVRACRRLPTSWRASASTSFCGRTTRPKFVIGATGAGQCVVDPGRRRQACNGRGGRRWTIWRSAIGRSGQNVRLASELTGWQINIMTADESTQKQESEQTGIRAMFMKRLDVDEEMATS